MQMELQKKSFIFWDVIRLIFATIPFVLIAGELINRLAVFSFWLPSLEALEFALLTISAILNAVMLFGIGKSNSIIRTSVVAIIFVTILIGVARAITNQSAILHLADKVFFITWINTLIAAATVLMLTKLNRFLGFIGNIGVWLFFSNGALLGYLILKIHLKGVSPEALCLPTALFATGLHVLLIVRQHNNPANFRQQRWKPNFIGAVAAIASITIWSWISPNMLTVNSWIFLTYTVLFSIVLTIMAHLLQLADYRASRLKASQFTEKTILKELRASRDQQLRRSKQLEQNNKELALEIKHRWEIEKRLQESEHLLKTLFDTAPIGIMVFDENGIIEKINNTGSQTFGYSRNELPATPIQHLLPRLNDVDYPQSLADFIREMLDSPTIPVEVFGKHRNGSLFPISLAMGELKLKDRKLYTAVFYDITERKKSELQLRDYMNQLRQTNRELKEFATVASHDLQEPLRKILTFTDLIMQRSGEDSKTLDYLQRVQTATHRMQALLNAWLTFSRISTYPQPFQQVDLEQIVYEVIAGFGDLLQPQQVSCTFEGSQLINADPSQLYMLIKNIVHNSIKFRKPDVPLQIEIKSRCYPAKSTSVDHKPAESGFIKLSIRDNGIGFDEKYLNKAFALFQKIHHIQNDDGTGIGLPVCQKIVERHGGYIRAKSAPGKGTTIIVTLPLKESDVQTTGQRDRTFVSTLNG
jgi:PAS domain S-box-containing protein